MSSFEQVKAGGGIARFGARARSVTEGLAGAELAVICSLISSLIHPRTPKSIVMYRWSQTGGKNHLGQPCTWIPNPEKRKVGGSTPPLTTTLSADVSCRNAWDCVWWSVVLSSRVAPL